MMIINLIWHGGIIMAKKSSRLEALQEVFAENNITKDTIEWNDGLIQSIKKNADAVQDYRHPSYT